MRRPKPSGNYKIHSADKCGLCAKPRSYRRKRLDEEKLKEAFLIIKNDLH